MTESEDYFDGHAIGYAKGQEDLYESAEAVAKEWYALKIFDDRQMVAVTWLVHHLEKKAIYTLKGSN